MTTTREYRVMADGAFAAEVLAKQAARDEGRTVRTVAAVSPVDPPERGRQTVWVVRLAVGPVAGVAS